MSTAHYGKTHLISITTKLSNWYLWVFINFKLICSHFIITFILTFKYIRYGFVGFRRFAFWLLLFHEIQRYFFNSCPRKSFYSVNQHLQAQIVNTVSDLIVYLRICLFFFYFRTVSDYTAEASENFPTDSKKLVTWSFGPRLVLILGKFH